MGVRARGVAQNTWGPAEPRTRRPRLWERRGSEKSASGATLTAAGLLSNGVRVLPLLSPQLDTDRRTLWTLFLSVPFPCLIQALLLLGPPPQLLSSPHTCVYAWRVMPTASAMGTVTQIECVWHEWWEERWGRERARAVWCGVMSCAVISSFDLFPNLIHSQTASPKPTAVMHFQQIPQGLDEVGGIPLLLHIS